MDGGSDSEVLDSISTVGSDGCLDVSTPETDEEVDSDMHEHDGNITNLVLPLTMCSATYFHNYLLKEPCHIRPQSGWSYLMDMINGHDKRSYNNLRMKSEVFLDLCKTLADNYGLEALPYVTIEEQLATFMMIVGPGMSNRSMQEFLQRSGYTISNCFHRVLKAATRMSIDWVRPYQSDMVTHPYIRSSSKYYPHFKDCIGVIDGTHILASIPVSDQVPFIGRKGKPTQNVMAACDFDMLFTFVLPGWEGTAHDTRIFYDTIRDTSKGFPTPPPGKYYLVDAGYPNIIGFLCPYKGIRYHLPDFRRNRTYANHFETFNHIHSSLRTTIERTFAVWKNKFSIMKDMHVNFEFSDQVALVPATMAIHNFIRLHDREDEDFMKFDCDPENMPPSDETSDGDPTRHGPEIQQHDVTMNQVRDDICTSITFARIGVPIH